jgi:hypothetical protein
MVTEKLIKKIILDNDYILEIKEKSRKISDNEWFLDIVFTIDIDINKNLFNDLKKRSDKLIIPDINDITDKLGHKIKFVAESKRHFIAEKNKSDMIEEMVKSYLETNFKYFSHPLFAPKYVLRKFAA